MTSSLRPDTIMVSGKTLYYVPTLGEYVEATDLTKLIHEYNKYIQEANEENRYVEGWYPVSMAEFFHVDMKENK